MVMVLSKECYNKVWYIFFKVQLPYYIKKIGKAF